MTCDCVKHAAAPHGPFGAVAAAQCSRFSRSLLRDQLHADREVVLVDLVDAVDQRDLGRGHVRRAAGVRGVARVGDQREPVGAQHVAGRRIAVGSSSRDDLVARRRRVVAVGRPRRCACRGCRRDRRRSSREGAAAVGVRGQRARREVLLGVADRDRDVRVVGEAAAVDRDRVVGVVVALVDRELGARRRRARRTARARLARSRP